MLEDSALANVTFVGGDSRITAHRSILASRSEYFRRMFLGPFREGKKRKLGSATSSSADGEVAIGDMAPRSFQALLRYLYTDELVFDDAEVIHVIQLDRVYAHCLHHCCHAMSAENAVLGFVQLGDFRLEEQREVLLKFIIRNLATIRAEAQDSFADSSQLLLYLFPHLQRLIRV